MYIMGSDSEREQLLPLVDDDTRQYLALFVAPRPPDRLSFACMRQGGPLSDTNKNPTCGKDGPRAVVKS